jgi:5-methylcytosine-specific restriction endonuclease McrA
MAQKKPNEETRYVQEVKKRNKRNGKRIVRRRKKKGSTKQNRISKKYIEWRKSVYERDNYTCRRCGRKNCYLNAHHIRPWSLFIEDRHRIDNGVTLCVKCHEAVHRSKRSKFLDVGHGRGKPIPRKRGNGRNKDD